MLDAVFVVLGLMLLTYAADRFVLGAARLSTALRISSVVIGAIVIGFGTSAPELLVTSLATVQGAQDLAFGNIVGSNIANVLLVIGTAAVVRPVIVTAPTLRRELPLMLGGVLLLTALTIDRRVTATDALLLLAAAAGVIGYIVWSGMRDREAAAALEAEVAEYEGDHPAGPSALLAVAGLLGTLAGAQLLVTGASGLARTLGVPEAVIGLTIVAVGTSLPELVTAVAAARRDETDLVLGNVLGSNIFNSLPVAGVAGLLDTVELSGAFGVSLGVMVASCGLVAVLGLRGAIGPPAGAVLLALFAVATVLTF